MTTTAGTVLVAGASGLVGHAAVEAFAEAGQWSVIGVSRRRPAAVPGATFLSVDLLDADACDATFGAMAGVTHLVYAALQEEPGLMAGWIDPGVMARNAAMLRNLFEPLRRVARGLQHVTLLHGTKAYGLHHPSIGATGAHVPLREREPRRVHPNFYFLQEDYLRDLQAAGGSWGLTVFRPTVIYGDAPGNNMNPTLAIAAYAAILRERGEPLHFPGRGDTPIVREAVDAGLVGRAIRWAAESPAATGGTFNVTNGDVFMWEHVWPAIADELGMAVGEHRPLSLVETLPQLEVEWRALVQRHRLRVPERLETFVGYNSLVYADAVMTAMQRGPVPMLNSTIAIRQAGFHECMDTEDMFRQQFRRLMAHGVIPPREG